MGKTRNLIQLSNKMSKSYGCRRKKYYIHIVKPVLDYFFASVGLILLFPFFLIVAIVIKMDSKGPVLFWQKRIGKNKKEFYILKFRTMRVDAPKNITTHLLDNPDAFITRIGKFLRKTSIDELPQIINILRGEFSIIGPRPALWNQFDLIAERDKYGVNSIYPGLTGWAQINGRDELSIAEKAKIDGEYIERMSFSFDNKILLITIPYVLGRIGVKEGKSKVKVSEQ